MVQAATEISGTGYRVQLEKFEGPLDLLLFLIKRDEVDIYDIPISRITGQFLEHVQAMQMLDLGIAGEFLVMAATLMRIKSKMLLPRPVLEDEAEEEDPRDELVRQLLEYRKYKHVADHLTDRAADRFQIINRQRHELDRSEEDEPAEVTIPVDLVGLLRTFANLIERAPSMDPYEVILDEFTLEEKVEFIEKQLEEEGEVEFASLCREGAVKGEIIITFIAILELLRLQRVTLNQSNPFGRIWIRPRLSASNGTTDEY